MAMSTTDFSLESISRPSRLRRFAEHAPYLYFRPTGAQHRLLQSAARVMPDFADGIPIDAQTPSYLLRWRAAQLGLNHLALPDCQVAFNRLAKDTQESARTLAQFGPEPTPGEALPPPSDPEKRPANGRAAIGSASRESRWTWPT